MNTATLDLAPLCCKCVDFHCVSAYITLWNALIQNLIQCDVLREWLPTTCGVHIYSSAGLSDNAERYKHTDIGGKN